MAKKVILIILGILLGLCGIGSLCGGGALLGIGGTGGKIQSGFHAITTPTTAFVTDPAQVQNSSNVKVSGTSVTLTLAGSQSPTQLFLGVGPTDQVNAYLSGAPYERITNVDFSPFKLTTSTVNGNTPPAAPGDQAFWVARATGTNPQLNWKFQSGDYEAVIMNVDGSAPVNLDARIGVKAPVLGRLGIGLLIVGVIAALAGLALLIWGIRTRRPVTSAVAYPGGPTYPGGTYQQPTYPGPISGTPGSPYQPGGPYPSGNPYQTPPVPPAGSAGAAGSAGPAGSASSAESPSSSSGSGSAGSPEGPGSWSPPGGAGSAGETPPSTGWQPPDDPTR
jgi:hypothetical protein